MVTAIPKTTPQHEEPHKADRATFFPLTLNTNGEFWAQLLKPGFLSHRLPGMKTLCSDC